MGGHGANRQRTSAQDRHTSLDAKADTGDHLFDFIGCRVGCTDLVSPTYNLTVAKIESHTVERDSAQSGC